MFYTLSAFIILAGASPPADFSTTNTPWAAIPLSNCEAALAQAQLEDYVRLNRGQIKRLRLSGHKDMYCHVPQAVRYRTGPGSIRYSSYLLLSCRMAAAVAQFEILAQQTAKDVFGNNARITDIRMLGAYRCRRLRDAKHRQSEHSFGNALDVHSFHVSDFGLVDVKTHWGPQSTRKGQAAHTFLHALIHRLRRAHVFTTLLTPDFNEAHKNHFHFDCRIYKQSSGSAGGIGTLLNMTLDMGRIPLPPPMERVP
ncbi:MAG: extensin family protein [Myxococcota bacterium]|nr:extensin family protein [Myxococcota bacterium]